MTPEYGRNLPATSNVFRCRFCCQWNGARRTERSFFNARDFAEHARKAKEVGFNGLTVWGEASPYHTNVELSCLAFARFTWNPSLAWETFVADELAPRLGGPVTAERHIDLTSTLDRNLVLDSATLAKMGAEATDGVRLSDNVSRRWLWLADRIARRRFNDATM
jgi:hypothetical protein